MKIYDQELKVYSGIFRNELLGDILPYWMEHGMETNGDGFWGAVDLKGTPVPDAPKSCVLNARILWTFSAAAIRFNNPHFAEIAERAFMVMNRYFTDSEYGGYWMSITAANKPLDCVKHTYAQAFVLYAYSKYYELKRDPELFAHLKKYFELLEEKTKDPVHPGYIEAFTNDWQLFSKNRMADNDEPRSMNTHLHILEAYAAYFRVTGDVKAGLRLKELMLLFIEKIIRTDGHLGIFFDENFKEAESSSQICSFGHDIEASWLLWEAAEILGNEDIIKKMRLMSVTMLDAVIRVGLDKDGGLFLESTRFGSHLRTNKHWWPQAETLVALMNGFQLTSDPKYWDLLKLSWNFIDQHVIDHVHGEWFTKVNRLGIPFLEEPSGDPSPYYRNDWKIDPWKCPYHNGRAMMELMDRIELMAVKQNLTT